MFYRRSIPAAPLDALVACLWYSEGIQGTHAQERLLPNGEAGIVFDLRDQPVLIYDAQNPTLYTSHPPAVFCGARSDCFVIDTSRQERVIGIQFHPGGSLPFFPMPASEVANDTYSLGDLWPREADLLREEMLAASALSPNTPTGVARMFGILERALLARFRTSFRNGRTLTPAVQYAIRQLAHPNGDMRVQRVADQVGFSSRRFIQLFREQTGLGPKTFQRVRRFQQVLQRLHRGADQGWASIAADCGYYDQAHFIHDFRAFAGMTPGEYVLAATPHLNHVPLI
jgi:AraC-like DNA-binding protein